MIRYIRKLNVNGLVAVPFNGNVLKPERLQKSLLELCVKKNLDGAGELSMQASFLLLKNVYTESTHSIFYNWNIDYLLVQFLGNIIPCARLVVNILKRISLVLNGCNFLVIS